MIALGAGHGRGTLAHDSSERGLAVQAGFGSDPRVVVLAPATIGTTVTLQLLPSEQKWLRYVGEAGDGGSRDLPEQERFHAS